MYTRQNPSPRYSALTTLYRSMHIAAGKRSKPGWVTNLVFLQGLFRD